MENKRILITQLGSPKSTEVSDVRSYLKEFLSDPRVIDLPRFYWNIILYCFILTTRPKKSAQAYKRIEFCGFFPLVEITKAMARGLKKYLPQNLKVEACFILSDKRLKSALNEYKNGSEEIWVFPQFPQYSTTTTACIEDIIEDCGMQDRVKLVPHYHRMKGFIDLTVKKIEDQIQKYPVDDIVISFHGIPIRYVLDKKDIYYQHCYETFLLIKERLDFPKERIHQTFQSRLGSEEWLGPYTDEYCVELVENGSKKIGVYCPSFVADCLETTDEIGNELKEELHEHGGELVFIPCLNNSDEWVSAYGDFIQHTVDNGINASEDKMYQVTSEQLNTIPKLEYKRKKMDPKAKKSIKIMFLTLFLDIVGFSIIFPMFPALAKYYLEVDPNNYFLNLIFGSISSFTQMGGTSMSSIVLFGGALGAIYSLLQFIAAPIWGSLSDRFGRKPILIFCIFGLFISYVLWIFAGSFTILILARFIGGIMAGNLSTATAVVADVTDESNRSKGMAYVGIAFAFGFIFGPALGGLLTTINPMDHFPSLVKYGLNPFSYAALLATVLSLFNLIWLFSKFEETLDTKNIKKSFKSNNPFTLFKPLPYRNVNFTNLSYFFFISAFSGMEFTLTFLAVERLSYTSMDNAYMFIFIGFIIALVQGGYVRRKANIIGEKKMATQGLIFVIPGLLLIAYGHSNFMLYGGLFFLAVGSAMAIPTLTSLVSIHTPKDEQGRSLGIFRSLGSLGRVIGPIVASLIYWKYGSVVPYILGAVFTLVPVLILAKVDSQNKQTT